MRIANDLSAFGTKRGIALFGSAGCGHQNNEDRKMDLEEQMKQVMANLECSVKALSLSVQNLDKAVRGYERIISPPRLVVDNERGKK